MSDVLEFDSLLKYMAHFAKLPFFALRPPKNAIFLNTIGLREGEGIRSVILDRRGRFQTELFLASQEIKKADIHTHPGVDSYELIVAGDFLFFSSGEAFENRASSNGQMIGENVLAEVAEDCPHGALIEDGACFLSFQHWKTQEPTSVGHSFEIVKDAVYKETI